MKKIILSVAVLAILFTGWKKKDDPAPTKTNAEYLTAHTWKFSGAVSNVAIDADDDATTPDSKDLWNQYYSDCYKDDLYTFSSNNTGTITDAGIVCNPTTSISFAWTLNGNSLLVTSGTGANANIGNFTIVSINDNTLKLNNPEYQDPNGVNYIETDTYIK